MSVFVDVMHRGGPFMYVLIGLLSIGLPLTVLLGGLGAARLRVPLAGWAAIPVLLLLAGLLGSLHGMTMVVEAVAYASLEVKSVLASAGFSVALYTAAAATAMAGLMLTLSATCAAIASVLGADDRARRAEHRLSAAVCAVGAVAAGATFFWMLGTIQLHEAYAHASAETRAALASGAIETARTATQVGPAAVLGAVLLGLLSVASTLRAVPVARTLASAVLIGMGLLGSAALSAGVWHHHRLLRPLWPAYALDGIRADLSDLPESATLAGSPASASSPAGFTEVLQAEGGGWVRRDLDGSTTPHTPSTDAGHHPLLALGRDRPASQLSTTTWGTGDRMLLVLTAFPELPGTDGDRWLALHSLGGVRLDWIPAVDPPAEPVEEGVRMARRSVYLSDHVLFFVETGAGLDLIQRDAPVIQHASLAAAVGDAQARTAQNPDLTEYIFVPGTRWTVQDLVSACQTARQASEHTASSLRCVLMPAYTPPLTLPIDG